jgi:anti-anti-sigma regulatory factor
MSTTLSKVPTRRAPPQCAGIALRDEGQALVVRPVASADPELTPEDDLPWLAHRQAKPLVVDLSGFEQFNSDLARWLLRLANLLPSKRLHLRNTAPAVRAGMRMLGFDRLIDTGN